MRRVQRIVHPSDFSRVSHAAFAEAINWAKVHRAELVVIHALALPLPLVIGRNISPASWEQIQTAARDEAQKRLDRLVARAKRKGVRATSQVLVGSPHEQILHAVRSLHADLLVIATHGRTGFSRFLLGSVAERVLTLAPCPVLTVRGS